jgi:hypothetical protein
MGENGDRSRSRGWKLRGIEGGVSMTERMSKLAVGWLLICGVSVGCFGLSLCDYVSAETDVTDAAVSFSYRYFDDAATPGVVDVNTGRVGLSFDTLYDSAEIGYSLGGSGEIGVVNLVPSTWQGQGAGTFRYYLREEAPLFAFGGMDGAAAPELLGLDVRAGVGYGRFTDVTPMARAMEIESLLRRMGLLEGELPDDVLMAVARIVGRRVEYETVPMWVADIENLIEGTLEVELDARSLLRMEEIMLQTGNQRRCGWAVQGGVGYELIDPVGGDRNLLVTFSADAAISTDPAEQMVLRASLSGPIDLLSENKLVVNASYKYKYSENGTVTATYGMQQVKPVDAVVLRSQSANISLSLGVGGADVVLQLGLSRGADQAGWSVDFSISAAMELL